MDTSDSKTSELWGRKFKIVKNGLDEAEVLSFVGGLMDEKNALASKLEHLHSLTKLAERTVIESNRQAQNMIREAEEKANAKAASIIAEAEEKAHKMLKAAEGKAELKESPTIYEGNVEVVVAPPIGLYLMQLHKHLGNMPNIEVLNLGVSADKSITIRVSLKNPTPLRKILEDLPEVETTADAPQDAEVTFSTKKTGGNAPVRRIMVTTRKQTK